MTTTILVGVAELGIFQKICLAVYNVYVSKIYSNEIFGATAAEC